MRRALELDPKLGKSLTRRGETYFFGEHDWVRAEDNMKHAFPLDPSAGKTRGSVADEGRFNEAIDAGTTALRNDEFISI